MPENTNQSAEAQLVRSKELRKAIVYYCYNSKSIQHKHTHTYTIDIQRFTSSWMGPVT